MEVDGDTRQVRPGDAILIPAGAWHTLENDGNERADHPLLLRAAVLARGHVLFLTQDTGTWHQKPLWYQVPKCRCVPGTGGS